ncbi:teichoic acid D-Ala incorporation-associated protein DltX [Lactiplantibacillus herbarum]|nr:teichoic acid D-Ala incorporation-associated protein DltX [Lactiplantibacillus herbarum]
MFAKLKVWFQRPVVHFIALTVLYFAIMLALVYLYGYSGMNQAKFIYNEF